MKKLISVLVALVMVMSLCVTGFAASTYVVAGSSTLCGSNWAPSDPANAMTLVDGIYTITYSNVAKGNYEFKVVENGSNWIGDNGNNFMITVESTTDVTINYDPATGKVTYSGATEAELVVDSVYAVGAGKGAFLNGINWDPAAESNKMTEADGVYTITYTGVATGTYEFKFAANGGWALSWGTGGEVESGVECDFAFNGNNSKVYVAEDDSTVTLKLDLSNIDSDGNGAKATVTVEAPSAGGEEGGETGGEEEIATYNLAVDGMAMMMLPGSSYVNLVVDATAGDIALTIEGSFDTYLDVGMRIIYPNMIGRIEYTLPGGSVYNLKVGTSNAEGEFAFASAASMAPGSQNNPAELVIGKNTADVAENSAYYYTWTATEAGKLTLSIDTAVCSDWYYTYDVVDTEGNCTYGPSHWSSEDPLVSSETVEVKAGDVVHVLVATDSYGAGSVVLNASFVAGGETGEEGGETGGEGGGETGGEVGGETGEGSVTDYPTTDAEPWVYTFTIDTTGILNVKISDNARYKIFGLEGPGSESLYYSAKSWSAGPDADYQLTYVGEYTVMVWCYGGSAVGNVDGNISCTVTFTPDEIEVEPTKEEYIVSDVLLGLGENYLTLDENAITTIYEFCPDETGVYVFTVNNESALVGYWGGGSFFVWDQTENKTFTLEQELTSVGQSIMVGVSGIEGEFTMTIEKKGAGQEIVQKDYVDYVNTHIPGDFEIEMNDGDKLVNVDITKPQTAVLGTDGFYHLGTANGPVLYVDLISDAFDMSGAWGGYGALTMRGEYVDAEGVSHYYDFLDAMYMYNQALNADGMYPLTEDLAIYIKAFGGYQGWYLPSLSSFDAIKAGDFNEDSAWLVTCYYVEPAVTEDEGSGSNPETGDMSIAGLAVAMMAATAAAVVIGKKKEF